MSSAAAASRRASRAPRETSRKLVVAQYLSLDGVVQAPGHETEDVDGGFRHGGWTGPFMREHLRYNTTAFQSVGGFLLGRRTYEIFAAYWPSVTDETNEIARALNTLPKYVVSTTLTDPEWEGSTVIADDVVAEVRALKRQPGKPLLVVGSSELAHTLTEHGLVDEYQLWLHPVVLGGGKKLFRDGSPALSFTLVDATVTTSGLVVLTYAPAAAGE